MSPLLRLLLLKCAMWIGSLSNRVTYYLLCYWHNKITRLGSECEKVIKVWIYDGKWWKSFNGWTFTKWFFLNSSHKRFKVLLLMKRRAKSAEPLELSQDIVNLTSGSIHLGTTQIIKSLGLEDFGNKASTKSVFLSIQFNYLTWHRK